MISIIQIKKSHLKEVMTSILIDKISFYFIKNVRPNEYWHLIGVHGSKTPPKLTLTSSVPESP